ncbi:hypothetical protein [Hahella chejuensis]|uniref:hypothetical protein n=1 Tax=Hahella chejuensis TaxID=158327 RepID=UPI003B75B327
MVVVDLFVLDERQRAEAVGFVDVDFVEVVALFREQYVAVPQELGLAEGVLFGDAASQGVVVVAGFRRAQALSQLSTHFEGLLDAQVEL